MEKREWKHEGVKPDGTFENEGGAVSVSGGITMSQKKGGCDLENCNCSEGHWICIAQPRNKGGIVTGYTIHFDNAGEMNKYLLSNEYLSIAQSFTN